MSPFYRKVSLEGSFFSNVELNNIHPITKVKGYVVRAVVTKPEEMMQHDLVGCSEEQQIRSG